MPQFNCSYAYDIPHYVDFTVEAETEAEAEAIMKARLEQGCFCQVAGEACYDNMTAERVFVSGPLREGDHLDPMTELEGFDPNAEPYKAPAEPTAPDA